MVYLPNELFKSVLAFCGDTVEDKQKKVLNQMKTLRFISEVCECEGCWEKNHYGCYEYEFNTSKRGKKELYCEEVLILRNPKDRTTQYGGYLYNVNT